MRVISLIIYIKPSKVLATQGLFCIGSNSDTILVAFLLQISRRPIDFPDFGVIMLLTVTPQEV